MWLINFIIALEPMFEKYMKIDKWLRLRDFICICLCFCCLIGFRSKMFPHRGLGSRAWSPLCGSTLRLKLLKQKKHR